ncbi:hypothetical protein GCM10010917_15840 [Paenibacillus physcomitrellae]|uniref:Uncharacterized protein n=1 Tax=Paenibacillus physcomitrellae TaxID=1619311 RepID=A0ABQ1FXB7_9BACL|nr:hypothetical protein GCM10010917_15840 [Paenibacillus physcomitrellae]
MKNYGLSKHRIRDIVSYQFNKHPDIYYYLDNQYLEQIISSLVEGFAEAMERNNKELIESLFRELNRRL